MNRLDPWWGRLSLSRKVLTPSRSDDYPGRTRVESRHRPGVRLAWVFRVFSMGLAHVTSCGKDLMSRWRFLSATLALAAFLLVPLSRVSGEVCFTENFDGQGVTPGQSLTDPPLSNTWIHLAGGCNGGPFPLGPVNIASGLHPGWTGNAIKGSTITSGTIEGRQNFYAKIPGMKVGSHKGIYTLKSRCWVDRDLTVRAGIGFSSDPDLGCRNQINFIYEARSGWVLDARTVGHGPQVPRSTNFNLGTFCDTGECLNPDVDLELVMDFTDPEPNNWKVTAYVKDHDSGEELVKLGPVGQNGAPGGGRAVSEVQDLRLDSCKDCTERQRRANRLTLRRGL